MIRRTVALLALCVTAVDARADDYVCQGYCEFRDTHFDGNVIVAEGATLVLIRSSVDGNILVYDDAALRTSRTEVGGNIQATGARLITVLRSAVGGSVQLDDGGGSTIAGTLVDGNIQIFSNNAGRSRIRVLRNGVGGDVQIFSNRSSGLIVSYNRIDGNLQGEGNNVPPTGTGNLVQGDTDGQFEGF